MKNLILIATLMISVGAAAQDEIIFPHDIHIEQEIACTDCHAGIEAATAVGERFMPAMDFCSDCHEVDDDEQCVMCHTSPDDAGDYPERIFGAQFFSHAAHGGADIECATCHGILAESEPRIPGKPDCRACHATAEFFTDCGLCHADPARPIPSSHHNNWLTQHALPARTAPGACFQCHTESGCEECHGGDNLRPRSHGLNFEFAHSIVALGNEMECAACHQDPQYCSSCHIAERVIPRSHSRADWMNGSDGGRHAMDASFEMEQCIACHDLGNQAPTCARCHGG